MTSKERAALRAQANTIDTTLMVGKGGVSETLVAEAEKLLDIHELVKGRVLETAMMTPREVCDALCEATGAEGIQIAGKCTSPSERRGLRSNPARIRCTSHTCCPESWRVSPPVFWPRRLHLPSFSGFLEPLFRRARAALRCASSAS